MVLEDILAQVKSPVIEPVMNGMQEAVVITDKNGNILYFNRGFSEVVESYQGAASPLGRNLFRNFAFGVGDQTGFLESAVAEGHSKDARRVPYKRNDGSERYYNIQVVPIRNSEGAVEGSQIGIVDSTRDTVEAIRDELTGAFTRNHYIRELFPHEKAVALRGRLESGEKKTLYLGLIVADLQDFKSVNDNFGHPVGDQMLKSVADLLSQNVRPTDYVVRYGGDEFYILLPNSDMDAVNHVIGRIRTAIDDKNLQIKDERLKIKVNFGASADNKNYDSILANADAAMYSDKKDSKNGSSRK